ncbi:MAG: hypothetical protein M3T96_05415 [Acidobacteriota bacterium]|nr:hypothetical protein [Acidobacteriota bacterium]
MTYYHTEDLTEPKEFDANDLDAKMKLCINRIITSFNKLEKTHTVEFRSSMEEFFKAFLSTHKTIRLLLHESLNDSDYASDAKSLVREQVEKVFVVAIMLDDPDKWLSMYLKDGWKRFYKYKVLIEAEETKNLPRFAEWKNEAEKRLEVYQKVSGVSAKEKELVDFKFNNFGVKPADHLKGLDLYFPTPGQVKELITDATTKDFLKRWHQEYEYLCGYSHIGEEKIMISTMEKTRLNEDNKKEYLLKEIILPTISTSYISVASTCTEAWKYLIKYDNDLSKSGEFIEAILDFWDDITQLGLMGKLFWEIHAKNILPQIIKI